jgi:hypothetical protein
LLLNFHVSLLPHPSSLASSFHQLIHDRFLGMKSVLRFVKYN